MKNDEVSLTEARIRNLIIKICNYLSAYKMDIESINGEIDDEYLKEKLFFKQYDVFVYKDKIFENGDIRKNIKDEILKILNIKNNMNIGEILQVKKEFLKKFKFMQEKRKNWESITQEDYDEIMESSLKMHFQYLPVYSEEIILTRRCLPERDPEKYYKHFHTLEDLKNSIEGKGLKWNSVEGDINLEKILKFSFYNSGRGGNDAIKFIRKFNGWKVTFPKIELNLCDKTASEIIFVLEKNDTFIPEKELRKAFEKLWERADKREMSVFELQNKVEDLSIWVDELNDTFLKYYPEWIEAY